MCEAPVQSPRWPPDPSTSKPNLNLPPIRPRAAAEFRLGEAHAALGAQLAITLPQGLQAGQQLRVGLEFAASPEVRLRVRSGSRACYL